MTEEYLIRFRLYGPTQISTSGEIGEAIIKPRSGNSDISGTLEFVDEAESEEDIQRRIEDKWGKEAQNIVNILSFVMEEGIVLGEPYEPVPTDVRNQSTMDLVPQINSYIIDIGSHAYSNVQDTIEQDDQLQRALRWYRLGQSTIEPEDKFVAFWTGLESKVKQQKILSDDEKEAYDRVKNGISGLIYDTEDHDEEDGGLDDLKESIKNNIGWAKQESIPDAIFRNIEGLVDESELASVDGDSLRSKISTLSSDRADIVHRGEYVDGVEEKSSILEMMLRRLTEEELTEPYSGIFPDTIPQKPDHSLRVNADEWFETIFENSDIELTRNEIRKRIFAFIDDLEEAYSVRPEDYAGWDQPLTKTGEGEVRAKDTFRYTKPGWLDEQKIEILRYLNGAGYVPTDIISRNTSLDEEVITEVCEDILNTNLVEDDGEYYKLTVDGDIYMDRDGDSSHLIVENKEDLAG